MQPRVTRTGGAATIAKEAGHRVDREFLEFTTDGTAGHGPTLT